MERISKDQSCNEDSPKTFVEGSVKSLLLRGNVLEKIYNRGGGLLYTGYVVGNFLVPLW